MNQNNQSRFLRLLGKLDEQMSAKNSQSKVLLIVGVALIIALGFGVTTPVLLVWLVSAISVVGSTIFWFESSRHGKNKKAALFALSIRWIFFAFITVITGGLFWFGYSLFKNFNPH